MQVCRHAWTRKAVVGELKTAVGIAQERVEQLRARLQQSGWIRDALKSHRSRENSGIMVLACITQCRECRKHLSATGRCRFPIYCLLDRYSLAQGFAFFDQTGGSSQEPEMPEPKFIPPCRRWNLGPGRLHEALGLGGGLCLVEPGGG